MPVMRDRTPCHHIDPARASTVARTLQLYKVAPLYGAKHASLRIRVPHCTTTDLHRPDQVDAPSQHSVLQRGLSRLPFHQRG